MWTLEDNTGANRGYCRILLDCMDIGIDVFPFRKGADPLAIKEKAAAVVEILNAAEEWRDSPGLGEDRMRKAVDAIRSLNSIAA